MYIPDVNSNELLFGVYIAVPEPYKSFIKEKRIMTGDTLAHLCDPHITLLPPTAISQSKLNTFLKDIKKVSDNSKSFWIAMNSSSNFIPISNVSFIKLSYGSSECEELHDKICNSLAVGKQRFKFHPHITLAHNIELEEIKRIENEFIDFNAAFICSKIFVDVLEPSGNSHTIIVLPLK